MLSRDAVLIAREIREAHDVAGGVDVHGSVPCRSAEIPEVDDCTVLPEHRMPRAERTHRYAAITGNPDYLSALVDSCRCGSRVAGQRQKLERGERSRVPQRGAELKHLWCRAGGIVNESLRPSDNLSLTVDGSREAV